MSGGHTEIAVVGIGCRLPPRSCGPEAFWSFLLARGDAVRDIPADRWSWPAYFDPDPAKPGKMNVHRGAFLDQPIDEFDAEFFAVSPREAAQLDPQQRLLLEVSWEALEDAGLDVWGLRGSRTGVYVGAFMLDNLLQRTEPSAHEDLVPQTVMTCTNTLLASRLSYFYDLRGPSMAIDTACSSSLVAVHEGVKALLSSDCDLVLAGGVNRIFRPEAHLMMAKGQLLAPDGRSKAFSASADGYGRGEGCGVVVLKRLDEAEAAGDRIYAVIEGTGVNQDGRTDGPALPSADAQANLVESVMRRAGVDPSTVAYVEAHGTGTAAGDPAEMSALGKVIGRGRSRTRPCVVGSVKAGVGHTEGAAGVVGLIKAALVAQRGLVPPQAWLDEPNPAIDFDALGLQIATRTIDLGASVGRGVRRVAVNSFGYGGTNAHVVLRQPPTEDSRREHRRERTAASDFFPPIAVLSAHSGHAVDEMATRCAARLRTADDRGRRELLAALGARTAHEHRRAVIGDPRRLADLLGLMGEGGNHPDLLHGRAVGNRTAKPVFVFSGMGPQWWAMGRDLLCSHNGFRAHADRCDEAFRALAGWSIVDEMLRSEPTSTINRSHVAQPANFVLQSGLVAVLAELGVTPSAVVGHSVGEVAAAHAAGVLELDEAVAVVFHRSRLQATTAGTGGMLATGLGERDADQMVADYAGAVSIAAVNGPSATTIAGDAEALGAIERDLTGRGEFARRLHVDIAYHSPAMDPIVDELRQSLSMLDPERASLPLYSTVDMQFDGGGWGEAYWVANTREPVRFHAAAQRMISDGYYLFLEIGPHPVLGLYLHPMLTSRREARVLPTLHRNRSDALALLESVAQLWLSGVPVNWDALLGRARARDLPLYPWQRRVHWQESEHVRRTRTRFTSHADVLGGLEVSSSPPVWDIDLSPTTIPWCRDHVIDGAAVFPATGYLEAVVSRARAKTGGGLPVVVEDLTIGAPLVLSEHEDPILRLSERDDRRVTLVSRLRRDLDAWRDHATARVGRGRYTPPARRLAPHTVAERSEPDSVYAALAGVGLDYRGPFRAVQQLRNFGDGAVVEIDIEVDGSLPAGHTAYPPLVDAAIHGALGAHLKDVHDLYVPVRIERAIIFGELPARLTAEARITHTTATTIRCTIELFDELDGCVAALRGIHLKRVPRTEPTQTWLDERTFEPRWHVAVPVDRGRRPTPSRWLVAGPTAELAAALEEMGQDVVRCEATRLRDVTSLGPELPASIDGLVLELGPGNLDAVISDTRDALELVQRLERQPPALGVVELVVVTQDSLAVTAEDEVDGWRHGWVGGFRRAVGNEARRLRARHIDHDGADFRVLARAILEDAAEELAVRQGRLHEVCYEPRHGARQADTWWYGARDKGPIEVESYRLAQAASTRQGVTWVEQVRRAPGAGEIELRIDAVGLNYKDVAKQLGLLTPEITEQTFIGAGLGMEVCGVVEQVGEGVTSVEPGQRLGATIGGGAFARHVTVAADAVRHVLALPTWTDVETAGMLVSFCTAHHTLAELGRLEPGEIVLIHGATGGVGIAAFQVARRCGARVFATASTEDKRRLARQLGAERTFDSRSLDFVDQVLEATGHRGVDVVLNTLPGDGLRACLAVAAECARVIEIGRREIIDGGVLPLRLLDKNVTVVSFDLDRLARDPDMFSSLAGRVMERAAAGDYRPEHMTSVAAASVADALGRLARSEHTGKLVIDMADTSGLRCLEPPTPAGPVRPDRLYLVTGGTGGMGPHIARWLAGRGARHLALVSRSGRLDPAGAAMVNDLGRAGVDVTVEAVDVTDADAIGGFLDGRRAAGPPLGGVVHAAAVGHDSPFTSLTAAEMSLVIEPKLRGAFVLHEATSTDPLDLFLLTSSVSALSGTSGQTAYAAANTAIEAFAQWRRRHGLPATAVALGPIAEVGMAASNDYIERYIGLLGMVPLPLDRIPDIFDRVLDWNRSALGIFDIDWRQWSSAEPHAATSRRFSQIVGRADRTDRADGLWDRISRWSDRDRLAALTSAVIDGLALVLGLDADELDGDTSIRALGLDSLMLLELQTQLNRVLGSELSLMGLFGVDTVRHAAQALDHELSSRDDP